MLFCRLLIFSKSLFFLNYFGNTFRVSNGLDSDQAQRFVGPDQGPSCLQSYQQTTLGDKEFTLISDSCDSCPADQLCKPFDTLIVSQKVFLYFKLILKKKMTTDDNKA